MKTLSLEQLLAEKARKPAAVKTPEIERGSQAFILAPTPDDRDLAEMQWTNYKKAFKLSGNVGFRKFLVAWCLCDAENNRLLDPGPEENRLRPEFIDQMKKLGNSMPMPCVERLYDIAAKKMGMSATDIDELEKNSEATTTDAGSGSKPNHTDSAGKRGSKRSKAQKK